jgi:hypothetical protein
MSTEDELREIARYTMRCLSCDAYLDIREREMAFTCPKCGSHFHETSNGLGTVAVEFAAPSKNSIAREYRPFWSLQIEPPLLLASSLGLGPEVEEISLYVPGFGLSGEAALDLGVRMTQWQPRYKPGPARPLRGCTVSQQRALEMAQSIFIRLMEQAGLTSQLDISLPPLRSINLLVVAWTGGGD